MPRKARSALWLHFLSIAAILATALLAASSPANASAFSFTQFDVPGASFTSAFGINDAAQIVGFFDDSTGSHAFLDTGGSFTQLDVPGATPGDAMLGTGGTAAAGINDAGQIAGLFFKQHGRARLPATPVPEPATLTLLSIGLTLAGLAMLRRRATSPKPH